MANITYLSRLIAGVQRNVDLSTNTLVVGALSTATYTLTDAILGRLLSLQDGSDVGTGYHTHDGIYTRTTALASASGTTGSDLIGDDATYSNFTPAAATVKGALSGIDAALASVTVTPDFSDSAFRVHDNADSTKKMAFEVSAITTSTVRTVTMPDSNVDLGKVATAIQRDGSVVFTANQDLGGFKFTGSADPSSAQDLATKAYVDAVALGLKPKRAVLLATTADITLSGEQTIDGVLTSASRVLVKDQSTASENGIYVTGSGAWTRATDFDSISPIDEINGAWVPVQLGSTQAGRIYVQYGTVVTVGSSNITFEFYNPLASLVGGDMIAVSGSTISVDLATTSGLESTNPGNTAGQLRVKVEASNPSLQISGSNELGLKIDASGALAKGASGVGVTVDGSTLEINTSAIRVKDGGITLAKMASASVDENKIVSTTFSASGAITGGSGTKVAVQVDNSSIEINSNALRVKSTAYDQSTITGGSGSSASVQSSPLSKRTLTAGESFASGTTYAVRWALTGETAGRVYKADKDATSTNKYMAFGLAMSASGVSAGSSIDVVIMGEAAQGGSDSAYSSSDVGKELYVGTSGALILGSALAGTTGEAAFCIGTIQTTTKVWVDFKQLRGIS